MKNINRFLQTEVLQWQLFDAKSGKYVVSPDQSPGAKRRGRAWRLCRPDRALKPKYSGPRVSRAPERDVNAVIREYCDWAKARGLTRITTFRDQWVPWWSGAVRRVDRDEYFAVTREDDDDMAMAA